MIAERDGPNATREWQRYSDNRHQAIRDEEARIIGDSLAEMDDSLRVPLVLRYFCDQDSSQIAEVLSRLLPILETPLHTHPACHFVSGNTPAISPMTLTSSEPEGMTILAF